MFKNQDVVNRRIAEVYDLRFNREPSLKRYSKMV
jgi:hypothetical protein